MTASDTSQTSPPSRERRSARQSSVTETELREIRHLENERFWDEMIGDEIRRMQWSVVAVWIVAIVAGSAVVIYGNEPVGVFMAMFVPFTVGLSSVLWRLVIARHCASRRIG